MHGLISYLQLKSIAPGLVPFFGTTYIYFLAWLPEAADPTFLAAILKCLPVVCLCGFVINQGASLQPEHHYNLHILLGLVFSVPGDFFLVWEFTEPYFLYGVFFFAIAHLFYAKAFGFDPLMPLLGISMLSFSGVVYYLFLPNLEGFYIPMIAIYMTVISVMLWRAVVELLSSKGPTRRWTQVCGCVGGLIFGLSDFILGTNKWLFPIPYARPLIMVTYWAGQLGFALSTISTEEDDSRVKTK